MVTNRAINNKMVLFLLMDLLNVRMRAWTICSPNKESPWSEPALLKSRNHLLMVFRIKIFLVISPMIAILTQHITILSQVKAVLRQCMEVAHSTHLHTQSLIKVVLLLFSNMVNKLLDPRHQSLTTTSNSLNSATASP